MFEVIKLSQSRRPAGWESYRAAACFYDHELPAGSESHSAAACGWFKSLLRSRAVPKRLGIPQRGSVWMVQVPSTITSITSRLGIPQRGSVWMVQVPSTITSITSRMGIPQRGSVWMVQVLSSTAAFGVNKVEGLVLERT